MSEQPKRIDIATDQDAAEYQLLTQGKLVIAGVIDEKAYERIYGNLLLLEAAGSPDITVVISSDGGSATYGLMIFDALRLYKGRTTGIVPGGQATSMAAVIMQACTVRKMSRYSWMRIHTASTRNPITYTDIIDPRKMKQLVEILKILTEKFLDVYMLRATASRKRIAKAMVEDNELMPEIALKLGLIDEII